MPFAAQQTIRDNRLPAGRGSQDRPLLPLKYLRPTLALLIRTRSDPMSALPSIRPTVAEVDRELPLSNIRAMDEVVEENAYGAGFRFALVRSFTVLRSGSPGSASTESSPNGRQRAAARSEFAWRSARTGARQSASWSGSVFVLAALGTLLGVLGSLAAARFLESFLYGVSAFDPLTSVLAAGVFASMAFTAALVPGPARRLARSSRGAPSRVATRPPCTSSSPLFSWPRAS